MKDKECFINYKEYKNIKEDIKKTIDENFSKEHFELFNKVNKMNNLQKQKLEELAEHYFDIDDKHLDIDKRFAYYQIIEDCFKIIKKTDETLKNKIENDM